MTRHANPTLVLVLGSCGRHVYRDGNTMETIADLSELARRCPHKKWQQVLKQAHGELIKSFDQFCRRPTAGNLKTLNGIWSFCDRVYRDAPREVDPPLPPAAIKEVA